LPSVYAVSLFTPSIIVSLGFTAAKAQLLSIPPFVCGAIYAITMGYLSDRTKLRGPFFILNSCVAMIGYALACASRSSAAMGYAAAMIATTGVYANISLTIAWVGGNVGGEVKRGAAIAMVIGIGNFAG
jgi:MFS family permease